MICFTSFLSIFFVALFTAIDGRAAYFFVLMVPISFWFAESRKRTRRKYFLRLLQVDFIQACCNPDCRRELAETDLKFVSFFGRLSDRMRKPLFVSRNYCKMYILELLSTMTPLCVISAFPFYVGKTISLAIMLTIFIGFYIVPGILFRWCLNCQRRSDQGPITRSEVRSFGD
jgi:hypothetical protein